VGLNTREDVSRVISLKQKRLWSRIMGDFGPFERAVCEGERERERDREKTRRTVPVQQLFFRILGVIS
jgi:hypothetical protein